MEIMPDIPATLEELAARVRASAPAIARASAQQKLDALSLMAESLTRGADEILAANQSDLARARREGLAEGQIDRLGLDAGRISSMADGILEVAALPDPIGEITSGYTLANGLRVRKQRVPLGVVGIIYENRPNVTSDAAALCIKSGNAAFLRGSSAALGSNTAIAAHLGEALAKAGLSRESVTLVPDGSRETATAFMKLSGYIDCLIPRGGISLIQAVRQHATVPYIIDGEGNCHIYVDESADLDAAGEIIVNAKVQRPSVCNSVETVLVHQSIAAEFLPMLDSRLSQVELRGDPKVCETIVRAVAATERDYATEFLDLILAVKVVEGLDEAISHIGTYGSGHSEAILTNDYSHASRFVSEVDAAAVLVNASTRFVDGNQLGLGAEIGISTQKLHARGPMGLTALTTEKFIIEGTGQIRP